MALHAALMTAIFVDEARCAVQCVQAAQEPWWKWLLQFALSIVPVAGGVGIAWMAFRWNSRKEHEQWILDQKKAEWRELLEAVKGCEKDLALISVAGDAVPASVKSDAFQRARKVQVLFHDRLFIDSSSLIDVVAAWIDVTDRINIPDGNHVISAGYVAAFTTLVEEIHLAARKDLGVPA